jgi:hypothetical protein
MSNNGIFFKSTFSLRKLIEFWRSSSQDEEQCIGTEFAKRLVADVEKVPELMNPIADFAVLEKHEKLVDALMSAIFPPSYWNTNLQAIMPPLDFHAAYCTPTFGKLFLNEKSNFDFNMSMPASLFENGKVVFLYAGLLKRFYDIDMTVILPLVRSITDENTGLERYFKMNMDNRFIDIKALGELPPISNEQVTLLSENMFNLQMWYEILPPHLFEFEGFLVINMFEVTDQEALSMLKFDLLDKNILSSKEGFNILETRIRTMYRNPNLRLGLASISEEKGHLLNSGHKIGSGQKIGNSFILSCSTACTGYSDSIYEKAIESGKPQIIYDLNIFSRCTPVENEIIRMGVRNILAAPLSYEGETIGILELGSSRPGDVNSINALKLLDILPLFALAMKRSLEDIENKVQAIIKEKCTAIHPSVEWRFRQAAVNLLEKEMTDEYAQMEEIKFKDVYPLYALSDIRHSSVIRNSSIQQDLKENLLLAKDVVSAAADNKKMPVLEHLKFRIDKRIMALEGGLSSGDEAGIVAFLKNDIEALFEKLGTYGESVKEAIEKYKNSLDANLGIVYNKRKDYEESVLELNEMIAAFVEDEEQKAQLIYPHYFEKYKTDGVEFTMYIGDSIAEKESYSHLYLKNIRLWQFILMCSIAGKAEGIKSGLKMPLELAHLILVQNNPLSIRFHFDQKKFDVDGTYNVHYEIMKKRIDKAEIRGREERLTQPGKIAVIYTQPAEAFEYKQYIEYLQSIGWLEKEVEELELEDLQGVYGLKALRVTVNTNSQIFNINPSQEEINGVIKELEAAN